MCQVNEGRNKMKGKAKKTGEMRSNPCAKGRKRLRGDEGGCFELFWLSSSSFFLSSCHDDNVPGASGCGDISGS